MVVDNIDPNTFLVGTDFYRSAEYKMFFNWHGVAANRAYS